MFIVQILELDLWFYDSNFLGSRGCVQVEVPCTFTCPRVEDFLEYMFSQLCKPSEAHSSLYLEDASRKAGRKRIINLLYYLSW